MANNGEIKIEKGVEIPESKSGLVRKYPWADMQPGDSFLVPFNGEPAHRVRENATAAASYAKRHFDWKLCTRTVEGGIRVWRIE